MVVSGLLQVMLGLFGGPGHLFPHCGPLVLAPSLVVAGLSAHREVALFCSAHWGLASLYVSPERRGAWWGVWERGRAEMLAPPGLAAILKGTTLCGSGIQDFCWIHLFTLTFTLSPTDPQGALLPPPWGAFFSGTPFYGILPLPPPLPHLRMTSSSCS